MIPVAETSFLLGAGAYTSPQWLDREQTTVLGRRWCLVADEAELADPGSYATATVGHSPLLVVRGHDGVLRAFQNICRHRGMRLLDGTGCVQRTIDCFYHQWRYGTDGELRVVPQRREQFPDLDPAAWPLLPASVGVWEGMVFAHPDPSAGALADAVATVASGVGSHRPSLLRQSAVERIPIAANWKLLVENHVDVYHLWYLHGASLAGYDHTRFEHTGAAGDWISYEPARAGDAGLAVGTAAISHLDARDRSGLGAHLLFPALMVATSAEFFATYQVEPVAPDRSVLELRVRTEPDADATAVLAAVRSFIDEDVQACEAVQAAMASPAFAVGPMARDHEAPITSFHRSLLAAMEQR